MSLLDWPASIKGYTPQSRKRIAGIVDDHIFLLTIFRQLHDPHYLDMLDTAVY